MFHYSSPYFRFAVLFLYEAVFFLWCVFIIFCKDLFWPPLIVRLWISMVFLSGDWALIVTLAGRADDGSEGYWCPVANHFSLRETIGHGTLGKCLAHPLWSNTTQVSRCLSFSLLGIYSCLSASLEFEGKLVLQRLVWIFTWDSYVCC